MEGRRPSRVGIDVEIRENEKGRGLYALRTLEEGMLIGRYTGRVILEEEWDEDKTDGMYAMNLANGDIIDGADEQRSSFCRFINHSKRKANCVACDAWVDDDPCAAVFIETTREIRAGEELLFDYGDEYWDGLGVSRFTPKRFAIDYL